MILPEKEDCPCVLTEEPVPPCTRDNCFHFGAGSHFGCSHCTPVPDAHRVGLEAENHRLKDDNKRLRRLVRDILPRLQKILADQD